MTGEEDQRLTPAAIGGEPSAPPRLRMRGVSRRFGATVALDDVHLSAAPGEIHALIGENGAGKSTLMKVLSGALRPEAGSIELDGAPVALPSPAVARAAGIAMIYQELALAPHLSVAANIVLGREPARWSLLRPREADRIAQAALEQLGHGELDLHRAVGTLSIAQRQLVEIARAVAWRSRVLILDEPTATLPGPEVDRLFEIVRRLAVGGVTIVYISHFLEEVRRLCTRFTVLRDGRSVAAGELARVDDATLVQHMAGRPVALAQRRRRVPGATILEVDGLSGRFAPRGAALSLRRGEVLGIAGLVGAGRTRLLRTLFALEPIVAGRVRIAGAGGAGEAGGAAGDRPAARWRAGVGMVSEDRTGEGLALDRSLAENVCMPAWRGLSRAGFVAPRAAHRASEPWLARLRVKAADASVKVGSLSGGNQQKVALARLLMAGADVFLLDEPTRGIDVGSRAEIAVLIDQLAAGDGAAGRPAAAVLIVSNSINELLALCDRVAVMTRGRLGAFRDTASLTEHAVLLEAAGAVQEGA